MRFILSFAFLMSFGSALLKATNVVYFLSKGFSFQQINSLDAILMGTVFFLEIPTGVIADRKGPAYSVLVGMLFNALGTGILWLSDTYAYALLAHITIGVGLTCISGALEAWMSHEADAKGISIEKTFINSSYFQLSGAIAGGILGAVASSYENNNIWLFATLVSLFSFIPLIYSLRKNKVISEQADDQLSFGQMLTDAKEGLRHIRKNKLVTTVVLYDSISQFGMTATIKVWQPYFQELTKSDSLIYLGIIASLFSAVGIFSTYLVSRTGGIDDKRRLLVSGVLSGFFLMFVLFFQNIYLCIGFFLLHVLMQMIKGPIVDKIIHTEIASEHRAKVGSMNSVVGTISEVSGFLLFGLLIDKLGISSSIIIAACAFSLSVFILVGKQKKKSMAMGLRVQKQLS